MKKTLVYFSFFAIMVMAVIACNKARGPIEEEEIILAPITGVELGIRDNVYISQGASQRIIIEGQSNVIKQLNKMTTNGVWKIYFPDKPIQYKNLKIYVTLPDIKYLGITGPGIIATKTMLRCDSMYLMMSGSGYIDVSAYVKTIHCDLSGKGDIYLKGTCEQQRFDISGTGRISSFEMETAACNATITGAGSADASVTEKLRAHISGSGSLQYAGNPEVETIMEGTGTVMKVR